ncbi:MAG TPA: NAD(P)/FAD-dependent oxidoreductase [Desulfobacteria bacterium]|nr:NAD(P)/FAD-dependent oxidoreductase [Desulfobacteria bacterium]
MSRKKLLIIGAGIAGLAAGCYGQRNGYDTEIFESHDIPGGLCTSWKRKGYTIDGCIYWLIGSNPADPFYKCWEKIGAFQDKQIIQFDEFYRVEDQGGRTCILYSDVDRLEQHLIQLSPQDKDLIQELTSGVRLFAKFPTMRPKPTDLFSPLDWIRMVCKLLPFLGALRRYSAITIEQFCARFKDSLLKEVFTLWGAPNSSVYFLMLMLACFHMQNAGYPLGGSLEFSKSIEQEYRKLGGKIHYKSQVEQIIVEKGRTRGLRIASGSEFYGDYVLSSANGNATMFDLLNGRYVDEKLKGYYEGLPTIASVQVSLGIDYDLSGEPYWLMCKTENPLTIADRQINYVSFKNYSYDKSLCPEGKSVVVSLLDTSFDFWNKLSAKPQEYNAEKSRVAEFVIKELAKRYPGTNGKVEMIDVATPTTYVRYTDAWQGAYLSWLPTPNNSLLNISSTLPGLEGLYMIGQWTLPPGGLTGALLSGRWGIQLICHQDKKAFIGEK